MIRYPISKKGSFAFGKAWSQSMLLIRNGKIVTMADSLIDGGDILIDGTRIVEISEHIDFVQKLGDDIIDATDLYVFPGFIDIHCHVGLTDDGIGDMFASGNPIMPLSSALHSTQFDDANFDNCIKSGITTVMLAPFGKNTVGGKCALVKTASPVRKENSRYRNHNVLSEYAAMKMSLLSQSQISKEQNTRGLDIRSELSAAQSYAEKLVSNKTDGYYFTKSPTLEAYLPLLEKKLPTFFDVSDTDEIKMAIRIACTFDLAAVFVGCTKCLESCVDIAHAVAASTFPIVICPEISGDDHSLQLAKEVLCYGGSVALSTMHPVSNIKYLPVFAGLATREGIQMEKAIAAITTTPAKICGFENRIGSLEVGKDADIAIFDANPLESLTKTVYTIVDGELAYNCGSVLPSST